MWGVCVESLHLVLCQGAAQVTPPRVPAPPGVLAHAQHPWGEQTAALREVLNGAVLQELHTLLGHFSVKRTLFAKSNDAIGLYNVNQVVIYTNVNSEL